MLRIVRSWIAAMSRPVPISIVLIGPNQFVGERKGVLLKVKRSVGGDSGRVGGGAATNKGEDQDKGGASRGEPRSKGLSGRGRLFIRSSCFRRSQTSSGFVVAAKLHYNLSMHVHQKVACERPIGSGMVIGRGPGSWEVVIHVPACRRIYPRAT